MLLGATTQPMLTTDLETREWVLCEDFACPLGDCTLTIRAGERTDLASIPRMVTWLINKDELGLRAPVVHDALYRRGGKPDPDSCNPHRAFTRKEADEWLRELAKQDGVAAWRYHAAYRAVRLFGGLAWRGK